jgi:hypothetical protein
MSAAAAAQDEMIATGLAAGESLGSMVGKSDELRESMMRLAIGRVRREQAEGHRVCEHAVGVPSEIKTVIKAEKEECDRRAARCAVGDRGDAGLRRASRSTR